MTARLLAPAALLLALAASPAFAQDRPTPEACAVVRATLAQQNGAAAAPGAKKSGAGRKLLGFAATALTNAAPQMLNNSDSPLKAAAGQMALNELQRAAQGQNGAAVAPNGSKSYDGGPDARALQNFGTAMGGMGPQGAKAQGQIAAIQATARATNGDSRAVQEEVLRQSGC